MDDARTITSDKRAPAALGAASAATELAAVRVGSLGFAWKPGAWVLRELTFALPAGEVHAILGPNGRGKTTLLRLLLGLVRPSAGWVTLGGRAAYVPQTGSAGFPYTVLETVVMGRASKVAIFGTPSAQDYDAAAAALAHVGLEPAFANRSFDDLSGGERQLVLIARALASEAPILIMDEPASALDLKNQERVLRIVHGLPRERGVTVVMTTHHPQHAALVADQAVLMFGPDEVAVGPMRDTMTAQNLERLYGVPLRWLPAGEDEIGVQGVDTSKSGSFLIVPVLTV